METHGSKGWTTYEQCSIGQTEVRELHVETLEDKMQNVVLIVSIGA